MYRDEDLVTRSKNGDLQAFEELVCRYERKVYSLAYRMMGNYDDANDIAQEAFLRAFQAISGFRGDSSFLPGYHISLQIFAVMNYENVIVFPLNL